MRSLIKTLLLLPLVIGLGFATEAHAQSVSNCSRSLGEQFLDINNVRARILNTGGLFYRGEPHVYEVPKGSGSNAIFASGIWIAGQVGGQLRASASRYGEWELWAGPLDENGNPPVDCTVYDRVYKVNRTDIENYDVTGSAVPDLRDWPTGLGAPTLAPPDNGIDDDEDGEVDEEGETILFDIDVPLAQRANRVVDLAAGERPALLGDQTIWWVMNDRGAVHESTDAPPIGIEVHGTAFGFNTAGDIGNTTFYKFNIIYKGTETLENAYVGIFSDPDLGDFADDYVGSDTTLGLGYVYNADNSDESGEGYGTPPPAAGYDFFQGPIVPSPGDTAYVSGRAVPDFKNLAMTSFVYYNNGGGVNEDPQTGEDYYNYMQGRWKDGRRIRFGGDGFETGVTDMETSFMYPGDPETGEGWSEFNPAADGSAPPNSPADRRFVMSTGPFSIQPGDQQEIVFGVVWAIGLDNKNSVTALKQADALAQAAFDVNFEIPSPPSAPSVRVTELNGQVVLEWENSSRSNNYLESYSVPDPFAPDDDKNYEFEGYVVYQFADVADQTGRIVAVYDKPNGVTRILDGPPGDEITEVLRGNDGGVQTYHVLNNLTNYRTYYFGVQAYAFNEPSFPKVYASPISRVEVVPAVSEDVLSEAAINAASSTAEPDIIASKAGAGEGSVMVDIVNPGAVTGDTYTVEFYEIELAEKAAFEVEELEEGEAEVDDQEIGRTSSANKTKVATAITYDIKRNGTVVFDGSANGVPAPQRENVIVIDGLQFSVLGPAPGIKGFATVANGGGALDPFDMGAVAFNSNGFPMLEANGVIPEGSHPNADRPESGYQQSTNGSTWAIHTGPPANGETYPYGDEAGPFNVSSNGFIGRSIREGWDPIGSSDFEWRFDQACFDAIDGTIAEGDCLAWRGFEDGELVEVPFSFWSVGVDPNDPADDYRMIPLICEDLCHALGSGGPDALENGTNPEFSFAVAGDHGASGGTDDPYSDWIYFYKPEDNGATPGEQGYNDFFFGAADTGDRTFSRQVVFNWNGGEDPGPYDADLPEPGTVFRYITYKPNQPGDIHTVNTSEFGKRALTQAEQEENMDNISVVPNPYKGASVYERSQLIDQVRITNLPNVATIRVFTLSGTLIKTIEKNSSERFISWDLSTDNALPVASGMYLIHVDTPSMGSRVVKFAVVKKRTQLNVF